MDQVVPPSDSPLRVMLLAESLLAPQVFTLTNLMFFESLSHLWGILLYK